MCIAGWFQPLCGLAVVLAGETIGKNIVDIAHGPHIFIRPHTAARSMTARILIAPAADLPANTGDRSGEETDVTHGLPRPHPPAHDLQTQQPRRCARPVPYPQAICPPPAASPLHSMESAPLLAASRCSPSSCCTAEARSPPQSDSAAAASTGLKPISAKHAVERSVPWAAAGSVACSVDDLWRAGLVPWFSLIKCMGSSGRCSPAGSWGSARAG